MVTCYVIDGTFLLLSILSLHQIRCLKLPNQLKIHLLPKQSVMSSQTQYQKFRYLVYSAKVLVPKKLQSTIQTLQLRKKESLNRVSSLSLQNLNKKAWLTGLMLTLISTMQLSTTIPPCTPTSSQCAAVMILPGNISI